MFRKKYRENAGAKKNQKFFFKIDSAPLCDVCLSMGKEGNSSLPLHVPRKTYQLALVICKNTCHTTFNQS